MSCWKNANRLFVSGTAITFLALTTRGAKAIGPDYQYIPDAPVGGGLSFGALSSPTLNDVVQLGSAATPAGEIGTGTVIGVATRGGATYLSILTALHVAVDDPTVVSFGSDYAGTAPTISQTNGAYNGPVGNTGFLLSGTVTPTGTNGTSGRPIPLMATYTLPGQANPEDLAVVQAMVTPAQAPAGSFAAAELALVTTATDVPKVTDAFANGTTATMSKPLNVGFTQFGYGISATYNLQNYPSGFPAGLTTKGGAAIPAKPPANTYTSIFGVYPANPPAGGMTYDGSGFRRFQNNTANSFPAGVTTINNYTMPIVSYTVTAPGTAGGMVTGIGGTGIAGDSGGPLMTSNAGEGVYVTPNLAGTSTAQILLPVNDTNNDAAVYVGYSTGSTRYYDATPSVVTETKTLTTTNVAVPLLTAAETNLLTAAMPPMPGMPSPMYVYPGMGSLDFGNQYSTNGMLFNGLSANGASGGPLAIPEPGTFSLLALGGCALLARRRARSSSDRSYPNRNRSFSNCPSFLVRR